MAGKNPKGKSSKASGLEDGATPFRGDFGERLRWLLDQFETRKEAGKVAHITAEYLPSYIKAKANPRFASIARLAAAKNVSLDWLASGTGSRWTGEADADGYVGIALQPEADARFDDAEATAEILFARGWLKATTAAAPDELRLVVHRGKSNEPVIRDGDLLLSISASSASPRMGSMSFRATASTWRASSSICSTTASRSSRAIPTSARRR